MDPYTLISSVEGRKALQFYVVDAFTEKPFGKQSFNTKLSREK